MDESKFEINVFGNTSIAELIKTTYNLIISKNKQLEEIIDNVRIDNTETKSTASIAMIGDIVRGLEDSSIKNHDNLIKLLGVIQKIAVPNRTPEEGNNDIKRELEDLKKELLLG